MGCGRVLLCVLLPPLAVLDKGCGTVGIVTLLTICGWVPGAIAALVVCLDSRTRVIQIQPMRPERRWP